MKTKFRFVSLFFIMFMVISLIPMKAQADPDPRYWHWVNSTDEYGIFVSNKSPTKYYSGVKQWVMVVQADQSYSTTLFGFRWNNGKEFRPIQTTSYNSNGKLEKIDDNSYTWMMIVPETNMEDIWDYVASQSWPALRH